MRIAHDRPSEHASFTVEASDGRRITDVFRDATTGLLIVEEETEKAGKRGFRRQFTTTVHPETGEVIPIEERKRHIDYADRCTFDEETKLELRSSRKVDRTTGAETIYERLVKPSGAESVRSTRCAFTRSKMSTLLDDHKKREADKTVDERFWATEYAAMDFASRAAHWAGMMFRHMRWQSESGLDPCAGFDREWFDDAKRREPDFARMFDYILQRWEQEFLYQDTSPAEIRRRVGR